MTLVQKAVADIDAAIAAADQAMRERLAVHDRAEKDARNLASRAKRAGLPPSVLAQREWIKANPCGFELG